MKIYFGCVGDDFTGASDAASFLKRGGFRTILFNGLPPEDEAFSCDAAVIAMKTRTEQKKLAVDHSLQAVRWLREKGAEQIFIKYCSTFDSTREGNIGPIVDAAMEALDVPYTILCPALPVNGRIVKDGKIYVNGLPLDESPMRNHPLTPMWDSDIAELMRPQGKYDSLKMDKELLYRPDAEIRAVVAEFGRSRKHFYVIPDCVTDADAKRIVEIFGDLPLLTGGSGLMEELARRHAARQTGREELPCAVEGPALVLAGSCSAATLGQIAHFVKSGAHAIQLKVDELRNAGRLEEIEREIASHRGERVLVYSSVPGAQLREHGKSEAQIERDAAMLEKTIAEIAEKAAVDGVTRIIVAGGETSGAVMKKLSFNSYYISDSVAPGVPIMIPTANRGVRLVLKSGNFGQEDFFERALRMTEVRD